MQEEIGDLIGKGQSTINEISEKPVPVKPIILLKKTRSIEKRINGFDIIDKPRLTTLMLPAS